MGESEWLQLTALAMVAVLVVPAALRAGRGRILSYAAAWLAIVAALVWGYSWLGGG